MVVNQLAETEAKKTVIPMGTSIARMGISDDHEAGKKLSYVLEKD